MLVIWFNNNNIILIKILILINRQYTVTTYQQITTITYLVRTTCTQYSLHYLSAITLKLFINLIFCFQKLFCSLKGFTTVFNRSIIKFLSNNQIKVLYAGLYVRVFLMKHYKALLGFSRSILGELYNSLPWICGVMYM